MHRLISFYNRNRKTIFITIFVIVIGLIILRMINNFYLNKNKSISANMSNSSSINITTVIKNQDFDLSDTKKSIETINSDKEILEEFIGYCNEKNILQAYNMLTDECKENLFKTEDIFKENYYRKIFNDERKNYTIENWNGRTYRIKFNEDILSTGKVSNNGNVIDYITVRSVNGELKLNINSFIKRVKLLKQNQEKGVTIKANYKDVYMDYEIYNFSFENKTNSVVLIDDLEKTDSIYIEEKKGAKYIANNYEITKDSLLLQKNSNNNVYIKFNNSYRDDKEIVKIVFSNIITNYNLQSKNNINMEINMK